MQLYRPHARRWSLAHGRALLLGEQATIMGILNVTPDSFSDGGRFGGRVEEAVAFATEMFAAGAVIVDVGGESTRPDATPVSAQDEQARVLPVVAALATKGGLVSIDTYRADTARKAVAAGAHIVNDVWGAQKDEGIARVAAETGAGLCLMHTGRERETLADVIADQKAFLSRSIDIALAAGVNENQIVLDPGFGFAKDVSENLQLIVRASELRHFGFPILVGTSRKRFVRSFGAVEGQDAATSATSAMLRERGADIFRVHDVPLNRDVLAVVDGVLAAAAGQP